MGLTRSQDAHGLLHISLAELRRTELSGASLAYMRVTSTSIKYITCR